MKSPESSDFLSRALVRWQVNPPRDPNFRPSVWERIRRGQPGAETWGSYLRARLGGWAIVAGLAIAVGGWTGHAVARSRLDSNRERMVVTYLSGLDPRVVAKFGSQP